jgi:hypothetical protein
VLDVRDPGARSPIRARNGHRHRLRRLRQGRGLYPNFLLARVSLSRAALGHRASEREAPRMILPSKSNSLLRLRLLALLFVHVAKPRSAIQGRGRVVVVESQREKEEVKVKKVKRRENGPEEGNLGSR